MCVTPITTACTRLLGWGSVTSFDSSPTLTAWRALLAVAVVFVMLATTGWTAVRHQHSEAPREIAFASWARDRIAGHALPDTDAPPYRLAHFFATLTAGQQVALADKYPLVVGNLNGAPVTLRYRANRHALALAETVEQQRTQDTRLSPDGRHQAVLRLARFRSMLAGDRQILAFDPSGRGHAAEVFGDLDRAKRISVIVPGVDTNLLTLERTGRKKNAAPVGMAQQLYGAERAARPGTRTAVIAWADYTAPAGIGMDAALGGLAADGAVRLNALVEALPGTSAVSLFCHSYGSVLCGVAAKGELPSRVSDIAVMRQSGHARGQCRGAGHRRQGVGDAGRRRLDPGRAEHGRGRARARRRPGRPGVRRAHRVGERRGRAQRLFRAGHGQPQQLRRHRGRGLRHGQLREHRPGVPPRDFR